MSTSSKFPVLIPVLLGALLAGCGSTGPVRQSDTGHLRNELSALEADPELANRAPLAIKDAEAALAAAAEHPSNAALAEHLEYVADRKIRLARAQAEARLADDRLRALGEPAGVPPPN